MLGFPTANLSLTFYDSTSLAEGIYYGYAYLKNIKYKAVMSIGLNPTFNTKEKTLEVYLIDYIGDNFYREELKVTIVDFIRETKKCRDIEELKEWIRKDIEIAITRI